MNRKTTAAYLTVHIGLSLVAVVTLLLLVYYPVQTLIGFLVFLATIKLLVVVDNRLKLGYKDRIAENLVMLMLIRGNKGVIYTALQNVLDTDQKQKLDNILLEVETSA